jgi:hypothetical protein
LEGAGEAAFKRAIDDALDRSETLVAVGTSKQNLESRWVHYEWDSFCTDMLSGVNANSRIFTYVERLDIRSLPRALRQFQMIEHGEGSLDRLYRFIANGLSDAKKESKAATAARTPLMNSLVEAANKILPDLKAFRDPSNIGTADLPSEVKGALVRRTSTADIEADPTLSRSDKDYLKLLWEVSELDQQRQRILERVSSNFRKGNLPNDKEGDALWKQLELLTQQRDAKMDEALKLMDLENRTLADIFK